MTMILGAGRSVFLQSPAHWQIVADILGADRLAHWDATAFSSLTLSSNAVLSWTDIAGGLVLSAGAASTRPIYSPTGFASKGPGVTADSTDDSLSVVGTGTLPIGSAPAEMWVCYSQDLPPAVTTQKVILEYGDPARRSIFRTVASGANRARGNAGANTENTALDFSGPHVVRFEIGATQSLVSVDGIAGTLRAAVPNTGTGFTRMLVASGGTISAALVTNLLSPEKASALLAHFQSRYAP